MVFSSLVFFSLFLKSFLHPLEVPTAVFHIPFSHVFFFNRQERTHAQQLRDEQDEAYYESVRADQEKERKKREEEDRKRREEETKRQKEEAKRNRAEVWKVSFSKLYSSFVERQNLLFFLSLTSKITKLSFQLCSRLPT